MKKIILGLLVLSSLNALAGEDERFKIRNLEINSEESDFGPTFFNGQIVFASSRDVNTVVKRKWDGNNLEYYDLFITDPGGAGELQNVKYFNKKRNKKYNEGPASFNNASDFMVYTQNQYDNKEVLTLKIVTSRLIAGKWSKPQNVPFNHPDYSVGQPSLSGDGMTLYFTSNMPGGYGGTDIYSVNRNEDGTWGRPLNMGSKINTAGNEMFPFIHKEGILFFSSDGHNGMGGLDIYAAQTYGGVSDVKALEAPINSPADDFSFIISSDQYSGYFSSNREGGKGSDDLYYFINSEKFANVSFLQGVVTDVNGTPLSDAEVRVLGSNGQEISKVLTNSKGEYQFNVDPNTTYQVATDLESYYSSIEKIPTIEASQEYTRNITLNKDFGISILGIITDSKTNQPIGNAKIFLVDLSTGEEEEYTTTSAGSFLKKLEGAKLNDKLNYMIKIVAEGYLSKSSKYDKIINTPGQYKISDEVDLSMELITEGETNLEDLIDVRPIYFDLGKYIIRPDAALELDKIVKVMNENPSMEVELGSHTDSRGSDATNLSLSDKRAKASADYIKGKISNPNRITGKGFGESQLINRCKNGVRCSEKEHQENRRTEFKIIKI
ncbi:MAG: OmpA family protein [Fluviicola sp.]|nr:OmpA family protein [Fluviicola sp.]